MKIVLVCSKQLYIRLQPEHNKEFNRVHNMQAQTRIQNGDDCLTNISDLNHTAYHANGQRTQQWVKIKLKSKK